jgi:membrane associated rhomboid family serine protease
VVGASGALFALLGACLALARRIGLDLQYLVGIVVLNFVLTFSVAGISKLGHIGGFVTGILVAVALAGLPRQRRRLAGRAQALGLAGVLLLIVLAVAVRTVTFSR